MSQERSLNYTSYLALEEILGAQRPKSDEHDEILFIVVHQVYELWFKQLIHELRYLQRKLEEGNDARAGATFKRLLTILKLVVAQLDVIETMTPVQFLAFRERLEPSSGFQSGQFRELEAILGRRDPGRVGGLPRGQRRLRAGDGGDGAGVRLGLVPPVPGVSGATRFPGRLLERDVTRPVQESEGVNGACCRCTATTGRRAGGRADGRLRRGLHGVALPPREDGRADDRRAARHGRVSWGRLPADDALEAVLP